MQPVEYEEFQSHSMKRCNSMYTIPGSDPLFAPLRINGKTIRNRFVLPAMQRKTRDYAPTPGMADTLRKCAEDGAGLIIAEGAAPDHPAAYWQPVFGIIGEATVEGWRRVATAVVETGAIFLM